MNAFACERHIPARFGPSPDDNRILTLLKSTTRDLLFPHLQLVSLSLSQVLYEPGFKMGFVYFPTNSIVSLQILMENGSSADISMVGNEGLVGLSLFMGGESTSSRAVVHCSGHAYRLSSSVIMKEFNHHNDLLKLVLMYTQSLITQIAQTAVCNRHHSVDQQLCRWLLLTLDRIDCDRIAITQELIASMLGVRREGVTEAAGKLQKGGIIAYSRGKITVLNRQKLEELSCECYAVVKRETDRLTEFH